MANVVKKHSISSELAQKMVNAAVAKARELGVSENVAILDDGGNLKASPPSSRHQALRRGPAAARRGRGGGWSPWRGVGAGGLLGRAGGRAARCTTPGGRTRPVEKAV